MRRCTNEQEEDTGTDECGGQADAEQSGGSTEKVEKKAFVACVLGIAGAPLAFIGLGIIPGIIALVLGIKAVRPNGKRPAGAIVGIVTGNISVIVGIPGCIIFYGTYINPNSAFVQSIVDAVVKMLHLIV